MKRCTALRRAWLPVVVVLVAAAGAGAQGYDVATGRFLTEEEYKKLSGDDASRYCQELAGEIDIMNDNAAAANAALPDIQAALANLKKELATLKTGNDPLASEVAELEAKLREMQELPRSYTVVPGDFLIKISAKPRIYRDEKKWKRIFRGNRDKIRDPNLIYPDQVFLIPRGNPGSHVVVEGETLRRIAGYWEIYGDRAAWNRIYEANRDKIANPDVIQPGLVLAIPR